MCFLSAGLEEVEYLHKRALTLNRPRMLRANVPRPRDVVGLPGLGRFPFRDALPGRTTRIALGDPQTSSLGDVTARALTKLYPTYKGRSNILYAPHSEDIMNLIRTGKADVGLVYRVDSINSGHVRISDEDPSGTLVPIQFGQAVAWTCRA